MRSSNASDVRDDLAAWSEPIIADYLHDAYADRIGRQHTSIRPLMLSHTRFWRALLRGEDMKLAPLRRELTALARLAGVQTGILDAIDVGVLDELMNVTLARFLRDSHTARDYSHVMLRTAAHLSRAHMVLA